MYEDTNITELKSCTSQILQHVQSVLIQLKPRKQHQLGLSLLSSSESSLLEQLTHKIQDTLNSFLPRFGKTIIVFLKDFFYRFNYDFDTHSFLAPLKASIVHFFRHQLNGLLIFMDAFQDIRYGRLDGIINLITHYPAFKNGSGPFLTTLLYSAVENAAVAIVHYLVEKAKCSLKAQNRRMDSNDTCPPASAGSTALHAAVSLGHRELVEYLIKHGADIYARNQAGETPLERGNLTSLLITPDTIKDQSQQNSSWQYMRIDFYSHHYQPWHPFLPQQSEKLQYALSNRSRTDVSHCFSFPPHNYSVDFSKLLLTQTSISNSDVQSMAWIRCRDYNLLNCYPIWQILLVRHYNCQDDEQMNATLQFEDLPNLLNNRQELRLNAWYFCDAKLNFLLDDAMNSGRRQIYMDVDSIGEKLTFDLFHLVFMNSSRTIVGHVRWLPKPATKSGETLTGTFSNQSADNATNTDIDDIQDVEVEDCDEFDMAFEDEIDEDIQTKDNIDTFEDMSLSSPTDQHLDNNTLNEWSVYNDAQQYLKNISCEVHRLLSSTTPSTLTRDYLHYKACFLKIFQKQTDEYKKTLNKIITNGIADLSNSRVSNGEKTFEMVLNQKINNYLKSQPLDINVNRLKYKALDMYIEETVQLNQSQLSSKFYESSIRILNDFIAKVKYDFETNIKHNIHTVGKELKTLPNVLKRIQLFYRCFLLQLPLYEVAKELLSQIESNTVSVVTTTAGSGKSTLLPVLLIADDYPKVIVTQPRRLACTLLCARVNQTMMLSDEDETKLAGWYVSGAQKNMTAPILYLTDGLMKEHLLSDDILLDIHENRKPTVFIIETHERNVNTDLCIALFLRLLNERPDLRDKVKLVLTSSVIDESISKLFAREQQLSFCQFTNLTMRTPYAIKEIQRSNENLLDVVQELYKRRNHRQDQILCFVPSTAEVHQSCQLLAQLTHGAIAAYPLIHSQSISDQQQCIERGAVFFSTTIAETSVTFPSLAYVVDTGMINVSIFDSEIKRTVLKQIRASQATTKQRFGRLGRTRPGEYHSLYDDEVNYEMKPAPQICHMQLTDLEFLIRRTHSTMSLKCLKRYLPDPPPDLQIQLAANELKKLGILTDAEVFTAMGTTLARLPSFGSVSMTIAVYTALTQYNCAGDLIVLSSILHVLNTSTILKEIPQEFKSIDGDFMTLINVMERLLLVKQSVPPKEFSVFKFCKSTNLSTIAHVLERALKRYSHLEKSFDLFDEYREKAQLKTGDWSLIAKSLLEGYRENIFVSLKNLQGTTYDYVCYCSTHEEILGVLDVQSTLIRPVSMSPVSIVLARDIRYSSTVRHKAVICFAGELKTEWMITTTERRLNLEAAEVNKIQSEMLLTKVHEMFPSIRCYVTEARDLIVRGASGTLIEAEVYIRQLLTERLAFQVANKHPYGSTEYQNLNCHMDHMSKLLHIFNPMIWRWNIQEQVQITVEFKKVETLQRSLENVCEVTVEGRMLQNQRVQSEFKSFFSWIKNCSVMRHPNSGVPPQTIKPQLRSLCLDIEERIARITDSKRLSVDLWRQLIGPRTTRETRMEAVAWIAVCEFHCHLEGGFVRDWVVGHYTARPKSDPLTWLDCTKPAPSLDKELIPSDLDCHLPTHYYFDIEKFVNYLHKYRIECRFIREAWRYIVVIDEHAITGPFTMDLIEPHVALTQDRIDFDVNNLYLEKDYTHELGMRVDTTEKCYNIKLETIIDNIKNKTFRILRPVDNSVKPRVDKMKSRGWKQIGSELNVIPNPSRRHNFLLVQLPKTSSLYEVITARMRETIRNCDIISIEEVKNPLLEDVYLAMKTLIAKTCRGYNPNEHELFHGTSGEVVDGILNDGFDDRYFSRQGLYGHGAYFADNPEKSHNYTEPDSYHNTRIIIYSKVILGTQYILNEVNRRLLTAPVGYHSILGKHHPNYFEYIVYRYGQALPYLKITYKTI